MEPRDDLTLKFIELWIALSVGSIALTLSPGGSTMQKQACSFAILSWILLAFSVLFGILAHSSMIKLYDEVAKGEKTNDKMKKIDCIDSIRKRTRKIATFQFWFGFVGLILFIISGVTSSPCNGVK